MLLSKPDDAADENQVDERESLRFADQHNVSSSGARLQSSCRFDGDVENRYESVTYSRLCASRTDILRQLGSRLTIVDTDVSAGSRCSLQALAGPHQRSLRPSTSSRSVAGRSWKKQLIASTMTRHCARPVTALSAFRRALNSSGHANAELRVVLDLLALFGAGRRTAGATAFLDTIVGYGHAVVGHSRVRWRARLRCAHSTAHRTRAGIGESTPAETSCQLRMQGQSNVPTGPVLREIEQWQPIVHVGVRPFVVSWPTDTMS